MERPVLPPPTPAMAAQTEPPQTAPALTPESADHLVDTQLRITGLRRQLNRLETRTRNIALNISELQLRQITRNRAQNAASAREAERSALADGIDELNRNVIRLTTLVKFLVEQHQPEDEPDPPATGEADAGPDR